MMSFLFLLSGVLLFLEGLFSFSSEASFTDSFSFPLGGVLSSRVFPLSFLLPLENLFLKLFFFPHK